jgi:histidinol-phosphate aminotransferase
MTSIEIKGVAMTIRAVEPELGFLKQFVHPSLIETKGYHIDVLQAGIKLDQNESPWDWPEDVKDKVLARLKAMSWNRYPSPFADELVQVIAKKLDVERRHIMVTPGSNYLIALVLQTLTKKIKGKTVLARPSFALYESHCKYEGIPYETWDLDENLEYDVAKLPSLPAGSMVVFASPNNPVGNVLPRDTFERLLAEHKDTLWVADEAYCEFSDQPYTPLLAKYPNLIILRTFSKTLGAAGVRLGYVLGSATVIDLLKKPRVPFLINQFTLAACMEVLENPKMAAIFDDIVKNAIKSRNFLVQELEKVSDRLKFKVKESEANFVLVRWPNSELSSRAYQQICASGVLVRNVSGAPGLQGCLRISVGKPEENRALVDAFARLELR